MKWGALLSMIIIQTLNSACVFSNEAVSTETAGFSTNVASLLKLTPSQTATYTLAPTTTSTLTATPTITPTHSPTASPSPILPVLLGTPFPNLNSSISSENISNLQLVAEYGGSDFSGRGWLERPIFQFNSDGSSILALDAQTLNDFTVINSPCIISFEEGMDCRNEFYYPLFMNSRGQIFALQKNETGKSYVVRADPYGSGSILTNVYTDLRLYPWSFTPNNKFLVYVTYAGYPDSETTDVWDITNHRRYMRWQGIGRPIVFSPDGHYLALIRGIQTGVQIRGNELVLFDINAGKEVFTEKPPSHYLGEGLAFSPDSKYLVFVRPVYGGEHNNIIGEKLVVLDLEKFELVREIVVPDYFFDEEDSVRISQVAYSPDGALLAISNSRGDVMLLDANDGTKLRTWRAHNDRIYDLMFSPDGKMLLTSEIRIGVKPIGLINIWGVIP